MWKGWDHQCKSLSVKFLVFGFLSIYSPITLPRFFLFLPLSLSWKTKLKNFIECNPSSFGVSANLAMLIQEELTKLAHHNELNKNIKGTEFKHATSLWKHKGRASFRWSGRPWEQRKVKDYKYCTNNVKTQGKRTTFEYVLTLWNAQWRRVLYIISGSFQIHS